MTIPHTSEMLGLREELRALLSKYYNIKVTIPQILAVLAHMVGYCIVVMSEDEDMDAVQNYVANNISLGIDHAIENKEPEFH